VKLPKGSRKKYIHFSSFVSCIADATTKLPKGSRKAIYPAQKDLYLYMERNSQKGVESNLAPTNPKTAFGFVRETPKRE